VIDGAIVRGSVADAPSQPVAQCPNGTVSAAQHPENSQEDDRGVDLGVGGRQEDVEEEDAACESREGEGRGEGGGKAQEAQLRTWNRGKKAHGQVTQSEQGSRR